MRKIQGKVTAAFDRLPYRAAALLIPFLVVIIHIAVMAVTLPSTDFVTLLGLMVAYMLPPAGKETVIPLGIALGIPWWYMALAIVMIDVETGLFMALNFDIAYRIPFLGPLLSDLTKKTRQVLKDNRWIASFWFFAIVLMVMVPVLGSGGIRGSIAGKLLGMNTLLVFHCDPCRFADRMFLALHWDQMRSSRPSVPAECCRGRIVQRVCGG